MNKIFIDNSIGELIKKLVSKELAPTDLIKATLDNIRESDKKYEAWVVYEGDALVERVRKETEKFGIDANNLFEFIPVGIKDIYNTRDFPTQMGSVLWKDFTPGNDARAVYSLKRQGAVVAGKTVTAEFAVHALERTLNPYDISKTPGTSSSGSAVAVTLGAVPFATGSQTAGSIVRPSSFCGIYGCKPSFGTIPRTGTLKTTDSLDSLGFLSLHQSDLRRGFESMRVKGLDYPISNAALGDISRQQKESGKPWRVGFVRTHTWDGAPQYAHDAIEKFVATLGKQKDIEVVDAVLPSQMERTHEIHANIYDKTLSYYFQHEYEKQENISPVMRDMIKRGSLISADEYKKALIDQMEIVYAMDDFFSDYDILISLSTAGEAPPRDMVEIPDPALMWTLSHLPVVSVPIFTSPSGMPFGMQVVARKYNDYKLFNFLDYLVQIGCAPEKAGHFLSSKPKEAKQ